MTIEQRNTYVPPALRAAKPKHTASRSTTAQRVTRGAIVSAALAGGWFAIGLCTGANTATAQAAPCAATDQLCQIAGDSANLVGNIAAAAQAVVDPGSSGSSSGS